MEFAFGAFSPQAQGRACMQILFSIERIRMNPSQDLVFWSLALVQVLGLASCVITRLVEATQVASPCRRVFAAILCVVCVATMGAMYCNSICWISCGATLSIMSVGATIDMRGRIEPTAF
jgi:hypothetical protein